MSDRRPPVNIQQWFDQVNDDPWIPAKFKNGNEGQLKLSDTTFRSGSMLSSTEYLHLRVIWHPYIRIEHLGDMMKNDPDIAWRGFVSAENIRKAELLFNKKSPLWQQYLNELRLEDAEQESNTQTFARSLRPSGEKWPREFLRPSLDCGLLGMALHSQRIVTLTTIKPTHEALERAYSTPSSQDDQDKPAMRLTANQPIPPVTPRNINRQTQDTFTDVNGNTPVVDSYQPAKGGEHNKPAADEYIVNSALLEFLQSITMLVGAEISSLDWLGTRLPFRLAEFVTTTDPDTGDARMDKRPIMVARVDGYLCLRKSRFERQLNDAPLAIMEVKPFTFTSALTAIRRQEGAEMASWISQAGDSMTGLLQSSTSGRKRRVMLSQHRHEIFIVVGEYGAGFEEHIRPFKSVVSGPGKGDSEASNPPTQRPIAESASVKDTAIVELKQTPPPRPPGLLAGSPSYISRVERTFIHVTDNPGPSRLSLRPQPTQDTRRTRRPLRERKKWIPETGDFLIMHEFGPFRTEDPGHMDVFIKRLIALMLELRGHQDPLVTDTVSSRFLFQHGFIQTPAPNDVSSPTPRLRKARSWTATTRKMNDDWEKPSENPMWRG